MRRLSRATLCALSLYLTFIVVSPAGDPPKQPLNLFVDVTSTRLVDEVQMKDKRHIDLAGVPVLFGTARQNNGAAPSVAAGIAGAYDFDLGHHVSMKTSGLISRVHTEGAGILSAGRAGGDMALRYEDGGTRLLLRPSLYASLQDDVLDRIDYALESKLWQAIAWGVDLTAVAGHAWRDAAVIETDDRETGYGRLGLHLPLFDGGDIELGYGFDMVDGALASQYRLSQGPLLTARAALADGWRLSGSYGYSATERGFDDRDWDARHTESRHRLKLAADWNLDSTTGADWHMQAAYDFEQTLSHDVDCLPASHVAMVSFGLNF